MFLPNKKWWLRFRARLATRDATSWLAKSDPPMGTAQSPQMEALAKRSSLIPQVERWGQGGGYNVRYKDFIFTHR
jgi:hypothetical protein